MGKDNPVLSQMEALLGPDPLTEALRERVRDLVCELVDAELDAVLEAVRYERVAGRRGYRNGQKPRRLTTGLGTTALAVPRARLFTPDGQTEEWQSAVLPRYERRSRSLDGTLLALYLGGVNTRRMRRALKPLVGDGPLSRSTISRLVQRLETAYTRWRERSLADEALAYLYLDAIALRVRLAGRVGSVPVLAGVGVRPTGEKVLLDLEPCAGESAEAWRGVLTGLVERGLARPWLCLIDGHRGLRTALDEHWPGIPVQRCTVHKLRNLARYAPKHVWAELKSDSHRIVYAPDQETAEAARAAFCSTWRPKVPRVVKSLEEAGEELLTFFRFPQAQWRGLRSTNVIERLYGEFRRRVKTQASLPSPQAAGLLLFGLVASGQIRMRRLDGWQHLAQVPERLQAAA